VGIFHDQTVTNPAFKGLQSALSDKSPLCVNVLFKNLNNLIKVQYHKPC